jgi:hypothetical protein
MTKLNRIVLISVAALMGATVTTTAMAASKADCRVYANLAVTQYVRMQNGNLGCAGFRWHNWYDGHYNWCRSTSKASMRSEALVRAQTLFNGQC